MARITAFLEIGTKVSVKTDRHSWFADEPLEQGGTDEGPTPYELLLGSLAACTTLTVRYYANFKGIDIHWIKAEYEFDRVHAKDCEDCESADTGMIEQVSAYVTIGGRFSDAQRDRLQQIVGRCPVHKSLAHGVRILDNIRFVEGDPDAPISGAADAPSITN